MYIDETSVRSTRSRSRSAPHHARLVAGQLEVDVERDAGERRRREVLEAGLERRRGRQVARVVVGRAAGAPPPAWRGPRAARRTRSCPRPPRARRRRTRACCRARGGRRPCGRRSGAGVRRQANSRESPLGDSRSGLTSGAPERRPVVVPLPADADQGAVRAARAGPAGAAVDPPVAGLVAVERRSAACAAGTPRRSPAPRRPRPSPVGPPRVDPGLEAALDLPQVADARPACAGRAARRRSAASGRPRAGAAGTRSRSSSGARMSGPSPARRWSKRVRDSVISSSTGPSNWTTSRAAAAQHEPGARGGRAASAARRSSTRHEPVMRRCEWIVRPPSKRRKRCLPWASTAVTARPAETLGPAVAPEARVRGLELVRDVPGEHRPDPVGGVVDGVALGHRAVSGRQRQLARPRTEAELDQPLLPGRADHRLAVDALEREPPDAPAAHGLGERREAPRPGAGRRRRRGPAGPCRRARRTERAPRRPARRTRPPVARGGARPRAAGHFSAAP